MSFVNVGFVVGAVSAAHNIAGKLASSTNLFMETAP
jgi:hypothetical protein